MLGRAVDRRFDAARSANADPAFLNTSEIDKLKLDADLVVLSGCDTAGPDARTGDSLSGLARAFFRASAHGLLVTVGRSSRAPRSH